MWILSFVTGAIGWSLTEYVLHRFAGHRKTGLAFSQDHLQHHRDPKYFLATGQKLKRGITVFLVLSSIASLLVGALAGVAFGLGFMQAYGYYEWIHWAIHARPPKCLRTVGPKTSPLPSLWEYACKPRCDKPAVGHGLRYVCPGRGC